jgi:4-amino-4-deoxy-L-arabinose transferase-like glycosyltransferase
MLLLGLLALLIRAACFTGLIGSDDLGYSRYGHLIADGRYTPELWIYAMRYGLTVPVALAYRVFGVNEWTTIVTPYLASAASVPMLVVIGTKLFSFRAGVVAGVLLATFPVSVRFATILVPEPVAQLYVLTAIALYLHAEGRYSVVLAIASGIFLALGYLAKEWSAFVVPAVLIDAALRRRQAVCAGVAGGALAIVGLEHLYYLMVTGDLFFRLHALKLTIMDPYALEEAKNIPYRLFKRYPQMMLVPSQDFGLHSVFVLALSSTALITERFGQLRLPLLWAVIPFLYLNFGSLSLSHYMPVFSQPRYLDIIYPPIFLMAGAAIDRAGSIAWRRMWLAAALTVVAVIGCYSAFETRGRGFYTDHVRALREIVRNAEVRHLTAVCFEGAPVEVARWRSIIAILTLGIEEEQGNRCDILVSPTAAGVPRSRVIAGDS